MPANVVVKLFALVANTVDEIRDHPITPEQFKKTVKTSERFLASFKQFPDIVVAQPLLFKSKYSYIHNLTFNAMAYCAVMCNRAKINDLCCQQLLSAILSLYGERQNELEQTFLQLNPSHQHKHNKRLTELLRKTQQHSWLSGYAILSKLYIDPMTQPRWPKRFNRIQRIIFSAHSLAVAMTYRDKKRAPSFAYVLKKLLQSAPIHWQEDMLGLLSYPTLLPPGTLIKPKSGQKAVILSVTSERLLVCHLGTEAASEHHLTKLYADFVDRPSGAQVVTGFQQIHHWWNEEWLEEHVEFDNVHWDSYPLDKPPQVLLEVQKHLNSEDVNIDKLADQIGTEPAFAEFLKKTATISNRNKLQIQQVKHGLMMHGYERTNNMLIEQALLLRLNQHYFPLQQEFTQFVYFTAQISAELAKNQGDLSPEQASNLICFACSGLFTQPSLKSRNQWQPIETDLYKIAHLIKIKQQANLVSHASMMCQAWQQPALFNKALEQHSLLPDEMTGNKLTQQLASLLGLSVLLARRYFFVSDHRCEQSEVYLAQAASKLSMPADQLHTIALNAMANSHCYRVI